MPATPKRKSSKANRPTSPETMSVAEAKTHFSSVIAGVHKKRSSVTILKRGVPVAEIIPISETKPGGFGWMRGTVQELGDIVGPTGIEWTLKEVEAENE
jgi:prevent-host-death family protein